MLRRRGKGSKGRLRGGLGGELGARLGQSSLRIHPSHVSRLKVILRGCVVWIYRRACFC